MRPFLCNRYQFTIQIYDKNYWEITEYLYIFLNYHKQQQISLRGKIFNNLHIRIKMYTTLLNRSIVPSFHIFILRRDFGRFLCLSLVYFFHIAPKRPESESPLNLLNKGIRVVLWWWDMAQNRKWGKNGVTKNCKKIILWCYEITRLYGF